MSITKPSRYVFDRTHVTITADSGESVRLPLVVYLAEQVTENADRTTEGRERAIVDVIALVDEWLSPASALGEKLKLRALHRLYGRVGQ